MKNRGSTPESTQGTSTQNLKQIRAAVREKKSKNKKVDDDGHRVITRTTLAL